MGEGQDSSSLPHSSPDEAGDGEMQPGPSSVPHHVDAGGRNSPAPPQEAPSRGR